MSPFNHPEFWLSLAFGLILGLIFFPPIHQKIQSFFGHRRRQVETDIQNAQNVYQEALRTRQNVIKELKIKPEDKEISLKIKDLKKEFEERIENQIQNKKQDFRVRQNLMELQIKNHLRQVLLDEAENKILVYKKNSFLEKDIAHFIKILSEKEVLLKKSL